MAPPDRLSEIALVRLGLAAYSPRTAVLAPGIEQTAAGAVGPVQYGIYRTESETVVALPGSNEWRDWRRHWRLLRLPLPADRQTWRGRTLSFHSAWMKDADDAESEILPLIRGDYYRGRRLVFVGHSYAGPLVAYIAFGIAATWPGAKIRGRTWGAPHPADRDLSREFAAKLPDWLAYENPGDIVARVPFTGSRLGRRVRLRCAFPAHGLHRYAAAIVAAQSAAVVAASPPQST